MDEAKRSMNCDEARDALSAYDDGCLSETDTRRLQAHLAVCPDCRAELEESRFLLAELRSLPAAVPTDLLADFRRRLERETFPVVVPLEEEIRSMRRTLDGLRRKAAFTEERKRVAAMLAGVERLCPCLVGGTANG